MDVFIENNERLKAMPGEEFVFKSIDEGKKSCFKRCFADGNLTLKRGTPVMLLHNIDAKLVNGLQGTVVDFSGGFPLVNFPQAGRVQEITPRTWTFYDPANPEQVCATRTQIPLKPAWAITAHKAQGDEYDAAVVMSGSEFVQGQLYVASSQDQKVDCASRVSVLHS